MLKNIVAFSMIVAVGIVLFVSWYIPYQRNVGVVIDLNRITDSKLSLVNTDEIFPPFGQGGFFVYYLVSESDLSKKHVTEEVDLDKIIRIGVVAVDGFFDREKRVFSLRGMGEKKIFLQENKIVYVVFVD